MKYVLAKLSIHLIEIFHDLNVMGGNKRNRSRTLVLKVTMRQFIILQLVIKLVIERSIIHLVMMELVIEQPII